MATSSYTTIVAPIAEAQINAALLWWARNRAGARDLLAREIDAAIGAIDERRENRVASGCEDTGRARTAYPVQPFDLPTPADLDGLDTAALVDVLTALGVLTERARARLVLGGTASPPPLSTDDQMLTAPEAAPLLGMSEDWVRRHGAREGFAVPIGRRAVKYSRRKITQYIHRRAGRLA